MLDRFRKRQVTSRASDSDRYVPATTSARVWIRPSIVCSTYAQQPLYEYRQVDMAIRASRPYNYILIDRQLSYDVITICKHSSCLSVVEIVCLGRRCHPLLQLLVWRAVSSAAGVSWYSSQCDVDNCAADRIIVHVSMVYCTVYEWRHHVDTYKMWFVMLHHGLLSTTVVILWRYKLRLHAHSRLLYDTCIA